VSQPPEGPEIVTYRIPRIEVYQVADDELRRIEEGYGQVGQDLTFAVASLSSCIAFAIALATASFSDRLFITFLVLVIVSGLVALYTGIRWWGARRAAPTVIATIRSRRVEPQVTGRNHTEVAATQAKLEAGEGAAEQPDARTRRRRKRSSAAADLGVRRTHRRSTGEASKYPPAKPGALDGRPLKGAERRKRRSREIRQIHKPRAPRKLLVVRRHAVRSVTRTAYSLSRCARTATSGTVKLWEAPRQSRGFPQRK